MERSAVVALGTHQEAQVSPLQQGFTVVELMIAILILAIMVGIGVPAYSSIVAEQKVRAAAISLHSGLLLARSEAIKLNRAVTLRPADGDEWSGGWLIADPASPNDDARALHRDRLNSYVTITSAADAVVFRASGRLTAAGAAAFELEAVSDPEKKRCVSIGLDGRPTTVKGGC